MLRSLWLIISASLYFNQTFSSKILMYKSKCYKSLISHYEQINTLFTTVGLKDKHKIFSLIFFFQIILIACLIRVNVHQFTEYIILFKLQKNNFNCIKYLIILLSVATKDNNTHAYSSKDANFNLWHIVRLSFQ